MPEPTIPHVYQAISEVARKLSQEGISKARTADTGRGTYKFRGIDDVYNALAPELAEAGLCILPRVITREQVERTSAKGGALFYTTVQMEFTFVSAKDGTSHVVSTYGEAMDSGDKGTNKAMSAAYKYAAMQAFCIPTEGDNDTENQTHSVLPRQQANGNGGGPSRAQIADLAAKNHGVKPENIPADLAEVGILPSPLPSNQWTNEHVQKAFAFYSKPLATQETVRV